MSEKPKNEGQRRYEDYWGKQMADPAFSRYLRRRSREKGPVVAAGGGPQDGRVDAATNGRAAGVSQAQVARMKSEAMTPIRSLPCGVISWR